MFVVRRISLCRMSSCAVRGATPLRANMVPNVCRREWMSTLLPYESALSGDRLGCGREIVSNARNPLQPSRQGLPRRVA